MKLFNYFIYFSFCFFCKNLLALNIATVDIQSLIDNNSYYKNVIKMMQSSQETILKNFELREIELNQTLKDIEDSRLILSVEEINLKIDNYNKEFSKFSIHVENFNIHYQNQIINIRQQVLNEIILLLENYAIDNNLELILDSTSYLIASNSIDITEIINKQLSKKNITLDYENFEKN